jgi:ABC-2 type transport system permease protein
MRNVWLVIKREYLERVRSKAFIIFTVLTPTLVAAITILPSKLISMKSSGTRHVVVVASNRGVAEAVQQQLESRDADVDREESLNLKVDVQLAPTDALRKQLSAEVGASKLDGYLWLTDDAIAARKFTYSTRNSSDFIETSLVKNAVTTALMKERLASHGVGRTEVDDLLKPVSMDTVSVDKGTEKKAGGVGVILMPFVLMMMIYVPLIIYGVAVMRSVLEEKTTRIVELLLSSITARQLMAGKILGVGAVGLTQVGIWTLLGAIVGTPAMVAAKPYLAEMQMPLSSYLFFPVFFILGYFLYSTMYATVASMVNSEEEAQQMQWPVMLPLIICTTFAMSVIRQPNSPLAFWTSMFPLTAPIIMFVRILVQQPPVWQIALSIAILLATIYGLVSLCSRIYRVGILMYGKRPTLPEIMKWIKYAG